MKNKTIVVLLSLLLAWSILASISPNNSITIASASEFATSKVLYFHSRTESIQGQPQYTMNTTMPSEEGSVEVIFDSAERSFKWFIDPPLAGDVTLNGTMTLNLWMKLISGAGEGTLYVTLRLGLYEIFANGTRTSIINEGDTANQVNLGPITSHFSEYSVKGQIQTAYTASAGSRLEVFLSIVSNDRATKHVIWGSSNFRSLVYLPAMNHIAIDRIEVYNATGDQPAYFETNDTATFKATILDPFGGYDIRWVNLTLEAPDGSFLFEKAAMVRIEGNDTSLSSVYELLWDTVPKMKGTYNVTVEAVDNTGYYYRFPDRPGDETFGGHLESLTVVLSVGKVISAHFLVQDSLGQPLSGAILELWDATNRIVHVSTSATGVATVANIPDAGNYRVHVWWEDVKVLDEEITIDDVVPGDNPIILQAAVYNPTFRVVDDASIPLGDANVYLTHPSGSTWTLPFKTNLEGEFALTQTAAGTYMFRIIWSGVEVGLKSVVVSSNEVYVVNSDVFYLTVETKDPDGTPVESVHVTVTDVARALVADSQLSNAAGTIVTRLPKATYDLKATWLGANVAATQGVLLNKNLTVVMNLQIFDVLVKAVDQRQLPLESATVEITIEGFKIVDTSDQQGQLTLMLPSGELNMKVWWRDVLVFNGTRSITETTSSITLTTEVYYVAVKTVDREGNPLFGVYLTLQKDGVVVDGGFTNATGAREFRQPIGEYEVTANLRTTYLLTEVVQTETGTFIVPTETVVLRFSEFPLPFTSTILFVLLLAIVATTVAIIGITLFILRFKLGWRFPSFG